MPSLHAAVAAYLQWPAIPDGWERHMLPTGDEYPYQLKRPQHGFAAALGEAVYQLDGHPLYLSTNVRIIGTSAPAKQP